MAKLYLLGGENVFRQSARAINERAFEDAEAPVRVLVFSWARASFDRSYRKRKILNDYLRSLGARSVDFVDYSDPMESIKEKLAASNLVYLSGGQATILVERLKSRGIDVLLKNYGGVIVGRSAGALALCQKCVTTCRYNSKTKLIDGIGLADLTLKVHHTAQKGKTLKALSEKEKIYALPQDSALVWENGNPSFINTAYLFDKGQMQILNGF